MAKLPKGVTRNSKLNERICLACGELQQVSINFYRWDSKVCRECADKKLKPKDIHRVEENKRLRQLRATLEKNSMESKHKNLSKGIKEGKAKAKKEKEDWV